MKMFDTLVKTAMSAEWAARNFGPALLAKMVVDGAGSREIDEVLAKGALAYLDTSVEPSGSGSGHSLMWVAANAKRWDVALDLAYKGSERESAEVARMAIEDHQPEFLAAFLSNIQSDLPNPGAGGASLREQGRYAFPLGAVEQLSLGQSLVGLCIQKDEWKCFDVVCKSQEGHWRQLLAAVARDVATVSAVRPEMVDADMVAPTVAARMDAWLSKGRAENGAAEGSRLGQALEKRKDGIVAMAKAVDFKRRFAAGSRDETLRADAMAFLPVAMRAFGEKIDDFYQRGLPKGRSMLGDTWASCSVTEGGASLGSPGLWARMLLANGARDGIEGLMWRASGQRGDQGAEVVKALLTASTFDWFDMGAVARVDPEAQSSIRDGRGSMGNPKEVGPYLASAVMAGSLETVKLLATEAGERAQQGSAAAMSALKAAWACAVAKRASIDAPGVEAREAIAHVVGEQYWATLPEADRPELATFLAPGVAGEPGPEGLASVSISGNPGGLGGALALGRELLDAKERVVQLEARLALGGAVQAPVQASVEARTSVGPRPPIVAGLDGLAEGLAQRRRVLSKAATPTPTPSPRAGNK